MGENQSHFGSGSGRKKFWKIHLCLLQKLRFTTTFLKFYIYILGLFDSIINIFDIHLIKSKKKSRCLFFSKLSSISFGNYWNFQIYKFIANIRFTFTSANITFWAISVFHLKCRSFFSNSVHSFNRKLNFYLENLI